jgi:signal transduction histidine kinase
VSVERVRDALRHALSDPTLEVWYWVSDQGGYVDGDGRVRPLPDPSERFVAESVSADCEPLSAVLADPALYRHRSLVDSAVAVSRLALENAQLQASLRSQLVAVREARGRLLHAGLEQRRRLERDLHDGAQQRLLALGMRLGAIENDSTDSRTATAIESARRELHQALEELRDLAHGLYPAVLTQAGLPAALEAVIERLCRRNGGIQTSRARRTSSRARRSPMPGSMPGRAPSTWTSTGREMTS